MELHIYGPAFDLPSVDAYCLAAIAHLSQSLPQDQWSLVASNGVGLNAPELPALKLQDGEIVSGLDNIFDHVSQSLEASGQVKADRTAFTSHIHLQLLPLLSLSLYITSQNYNDVTIRAWNKILPSPSQYYVPSNERKQAEKRTQHLGLSSLDLDLEAEGDEVDKRRQSILPAQLRGFDLGAQSVTGLLKKERAKERFKLDALIENAFEPLSLLLAEKKWFLDDDRPSSLDALALGCLSLAYKPDLPISWLKQGLKRYTNLAAFVERGIEGTYGGAVDVDNILQMASDSKPHGSLPWKSPAPVTITNRATGLVKQVASSTPLSWSDDRVLQPPTPNTEALAQSWNPIYIGLAATAAVGAAVGAFAFTSLAHPFQRQSEPRKLSDLGEAGALLNMFDFTSNASDPAAREGKVEISSVGIEKDAD